MGIQDFVFQECVQAKRELYSEAFAEYFYVGRENRVPG